MIKAHDPARWEWRPAVAALLFAAAVIGFGLASPDYAHLQHPVALLGGNHEPHALAFNLLGFVLPGVLLGWCALRMRASQREASWAMRIGLQLCLLSALAFAAQGLLPLEPTDLLAQASRLHALAWTLWWIAFGAGALLVAAATPSRRVIGIAMALAVPLLAVFGALLMPAPVAQRIAFALWFGWWLVYSRRV